MPVWRAGISRYRKQSSCCMVYLSLQGNMHSESPSATWLFAPAVTVLIEISGLAYITSEKFLLSLVCQQLPLQWQSTNSSLWLPVSHSCNTLLLKKQTYLWKSYECYLAVCHSANSCTICGGLFSLQLQLLILRLSEDDNCLLPIERKKPFGLTQCTAVH